MFIVDVDDDNDRHSLNKSNKAPQTFTKTTVARPVAAKVLLQEH